MTLSSLALDANALMNATFVKPSWSRKVVQRAATAHCKLVIGAATLMEAETKTREHAVALGKRFDPVEGLHQVLRRFNFEVLGGASYPAPPPSVPRRDKHVYQEAMAAGAVLLTNDRELWGACGDRARTPHQVLREWFPEQSALIFFGEVPTAEAGSVYFRGTPSWGGMNRVTGRFYAFDLGGELCAYYDADAKQWVVELPGHRALRVPRAIGVGDEQVVCVTWKSGKLARLYVAGAAKTDDVQITAPFSFKGAGGRLSLGTTHDSQGSWNGHVCYGVINDRPVSTDLWKQISTTRALTPNPYDDDRLRDWLARLLPY